MHSRSFTHTLIASLVLGLGLGVPCASAQGAAGSAIEELKKLNATLVREGTLNYRYPPKLREEVNSLLFAISGTIAPPTEPQLLRLRETTEEAAQVQASLDKIIAGPIAAVNEKLKTRPQIVSQ